MAGYGDLGTSPDLTHIKLKPTFIQDAFKTITLSLAPFVPFSQRYTMELHKMQSSEGSGIDTSAPSFFSISPTETGYEPRWEATVGDYLARNQLNESDIGDLAPNVDHLLTPMAQKLSKLLDAMPGEAKTHQKQMSSSVIGELVGEHSMDYLRQVLEAGGVEGESPSQISERLLTETGLSPQTYDVVRTDATEPFFQAMNTLLTKIDMDRVVAAEVTDSQFKKEISPASLKGKSFDEAIPIMEKQINKLYGNINKVMKETVESIKIGGKMDEQALLKYLFDHPAMAKNAIPAAVDLPRQFADRFYGLEAQKAVTPDMDSYLYSLPLGDTGGLANIQLWLEWAGDIPQMKWITEYVAGGDSEYFFMNLGLAVQNELNVDDAIFTDKTMKGITIAAMNDYFASTSTDQTIDWAMATNVENALSPDVNVDMRKAYNGQIGAAGATRLTSSDIASMLAAQFKSFQQDGNAGTKFAEAWKEIFAESNEATKLWKRNVTAKQVNFNYREGVTDPSQQGVWSQNTNETWTPERNPRYGINLSMAPIVISQAGASVARFTKRMMGKTVPARAADDRHGIKVGDPVKYRASFLPYKPADQYEGDKPAASAYGYFLNEDMPNFL